MSDVQTDQADSTESIVDGVSNRPRVWTVFAAVVFALVLSIGFQSLLSLGMVGFYLSNGLEPTELGKRIVEDFATPTLFLLTICLGQLGFGVAGYFCVWKSPVPWRKRIAWAMPLPSNSVYVLAALGTIVPTAIGLKSAEWLADFLPADPSFAAMFENLTIPSAAAFVVLIGVLPGFCEEIVFRGYMQTRLVRRWGAVTGVMVTSVVFALVHIMPLNIIAVLPIGLWFGYIAWRSKSIWPTILCHLCVNSGVNLWRMILKFNEVPEPVQLWVPNFAIVIGLVCFAMCLRPPYWNAQ
jgi:membrane protease YdiL (CAAX protease family)